MAASPAPPRALDLAFEGADVLRARAFDDTFFQTGDPWGETWHVFVEANRLPQRFSTLPPGAVFTICETGFGTGLSALSAMEAWDAFAPAGAELRFESLDAHPLDAATASRAVAATDAPKGAAARLFDVWDDIWRDGARPRPGITVRAIEDDVLAALPRLPVADAWFLDGFAPSRNPAMWSQAVMAGVADRSRAGTTAATFTAAGWVRRNLADAGFTVERVAGFGAKRHMSVARMA